MIQIIFIPVNMKLDNSKWFVKVQINMTKITWNVIMMLLLKLYFLFKV